MTKDSINERASAYLLFIMHIISHYLRNLQQKSNQHNKKTIFLANLLK
ncbi:MAG: hypothetical protein ACYTXT_08290 [Nostoc sp.]